MAHELLLNPLHRQAGATLGPWREWIVPLRFSDSEAEYRTVRQQAGLIDHSTMGLIEVRGSDRVAFLHNLLTNDIKALAPETGCQAALVSPTAKLLADLLVLADDECHWLFVDRRQVDTVLKTLGHYLVTEDVTFQDHSATRVVISVQGPTSLPVIQTANDESFTLVAPCQHVQMTVESVSVHLIAHSLTGEPGVLLVVLAEQAAWLWAWLLERGRPQGVVPVGWEALNVLRIEAGIPWYGIDMDETNLLPETGLEERAVSDTKGCYVGQEVIARLHTYGSVSRKLTGLVCEGLLVPKAADPIRKDDHVVGEIRSACFSPALQKPIAMGYVARPCYEAGTVMEIRHNNHPIAATVVKRPFV